MFKSAKKLFFDDLNPATLRAGFSRIGEDDMRTKDFSPNDEGVAAPLSKYDRQSIKRRLIPFS
jgi:hypothetical protein